MQTSSTIEPGDRFVPTSEALEMMGVSRTKAWRLVRSGELARPVKLAANRQAWLLSDIQKWMTKKRGRPQLKTTAPDGSQKRDEEGGGDIHYINNHIGNDSVVFCVSMFKRVAQPFY